MQDFRAKAGHQSGSDLAEEFINKLTLGGVLAILLGAGILGAGLYQAKTVLQAQSWPVVQGQVLSSDLQVNKRKRIGKPGYYTSHVVNLNFEYIVDGNVYRSNRISFGQMAHSEAEADVYLAKYQVGDAVSVTYNPSRPEHGALETGTPSGTRAFLWIGAGAIVVGVVALAGVGLIRRKDQKLLDETTQVSPYSTESDISSGGALMRRPI